MDTHRAYRAHRAHCAQGVARTLLVFFAAALLAACASRPDMGMGSGPTPMPIARVGPPLSTVDRNFVTQVVAKGMYEVEVSKLAAERALSPAVRSYAQTMVAHHTQLNNELFSLMSSRGMAPPTALAPDKAAKLNRLASLPRSDAFDNGYIRVVGVEDHRAEIAMFEKARRTIRDQDLRAWMERTLVTLRTHLSMAQSVAASLAG